MTIEEPACWEAVPNEGQNRCTRERGHDGEHRCKASDVDARAARAKPTEIEELAATINAMHQQFLVQSNAREKLMDILRELSVHLSKRDDVDGLRIIEAGLQAARKAGDGQ